VEGLNRKEGKGEREKVGSFKREAGTPGFTTSNGERRTSRTRQTMREDLKKTSRERCLDRRKGGVSVKHLYGREKKKLKDPFPYYGGRGSSHRRLFLLRNRRGIFKGNPRGVWKVLDLSYIGREASDLTNFRGRKKGKHD